jgi:hypothetical protein
MSICTKCEDGVLGKRNRSGLCRICNYSRPRTEEWKRKIGESRIGDKNPMWAGDRVGIDALHDYVRRRIPKPNLCTRCRHRPAHDLSNKGIYDRNLDNWEWICRKCHMTIDGRLDRMYHGGRKPKT